MLSDIPFSVGFIFTLLLTVSSHPPAHHCHANPSEGDHTHKPLLLLLRQCGVLIALCFQRLKVRIDILRKSVLAAEFFPTFLLPSALGTLRPQNSNKPHTRV